ncbi:MAG TPA: undecaprenyl-diphosphate phosphatase [Candidatus Dojkabacteria bacterium]|jgi:undecaprenyl-diphosphatase
MNTLQVIILSIIQGITEFLPVSSSGHLSLLPKLFGWNQQPTSFDIVLHAGTLLAIIFFFRLKLQKNLKGILNKDKKSIALTKKIIIGVVPALVIGFILALSNEYTDDKIDSILKGEYLTIFLLIFIGIIFLYSKNIFKGKTVQIEELPTRNVLNIGFGQILAFMRGTSRSGITILFGLANGLKIKDAAEFSFLMGIPLIAFSFFYQLGVFILEGESGVSLFHYALGFIVSFVSGYLAISLMLKYLENHGLAIFGFYRIILGIIALIILL